MTDELAPLQQAVWIGSSHPFDLHEVYLCFRSPVITLSSVLPAAADLLISGDSRYKLWVNGRFVARGPERCYPFQQAIDRLDLLPFLQPGENRLAVQLYQPGYSHFSYLHRGAAGLIAAFVCDGETQLVTDTGWRVRRDPSWSSQTERISIYGSGVELRDYHLTDDWLESAYNDASWEQARVVALPGMSPWPGFQPRTMPLLNERNEPLLPTASRRGPASQDADPHAALRNGWFAAEAAPVDCDDDGWIAATLAADEAGYWLCDLRRSHTCQGVMSVRGASGHETVRISYAEKIRDGELVISDPATYCRVRMTDLFHLRPGDQAVATFALRGGRYLIFQLEGPCDPGLELRLSVRVSEYPLERSKPLPPDGRIAFDDPILSDVATMCEATLAACLQDSFIDCGWRENSQWLGDALPQALILAAISDDVRPLRKAITMAAAGAYPDGILPSILPGEVHAYAVLDYNFVWVELLTLYLKLTGDRELVMQLWPTLARMLDRFDADVASDQLIRSQPGRRLFLDWAPLSRAEPNALYNLRYLHALQLSVTLARSLAGCDVEAMLWSSRVQLLQQAIVATFWQDERWLDDPAGTTFSQHSAAFALLTDLTPSASVAAQLDALAARSLDPDDEARPDQMVLASPFMHHYVFEALRKHGRDRAVLNIIRLRWGRWTEAGYPTTWENWNVDFPDGSQSHAFSAHPRYHLAEIVKSAG